MLRYLLDKRKLESAGGAKGNVEDCQNSLDSSSNNCHGLAVVLKTFQQKKKKKKCLPSCDARGKSKIVGLIIWGP